MTQETLKQLANEMIDTLPFNTPEYWIGRIKEALAQPEQEPVAFEMDWPDYHAEAMGCGLEDRNITDRYEAMQYGWDEAIERIAERLPEAFYITPPQRKPLTHEQRFDLLTKFEPYKNKWGALAILIDMVEAAHGIKE